MIAESPRLSEYISLSHFTVMDVPVVAGNSVVGSDRVRYFHPMLFSGRAFVCLNLLHSPVMFCGLIE